MTRPASLFVALRLLAIGRRNALAVADGVSVVPDLFAALLPSLRACFDSGLFALDDGRLSST